MEPSGPHFMAHLFHALAYINLHEMMPSSSCLSGVVISALVLLAVESPLIIFRPSAFNMIMNISGSICIFGLTFVMPPCEIFLCPFLYVKPPCASTP
jgi:hypothetical protein